MKLKEASKNRPDAYRVSLYGTDNDDAPDQFFKTDPRAVLPPPWNVCSQRRMTWHGPVVVADLCYRDGQLWDGYDTNQIRGYSNFNEFLADEVIRPADYYHYKPKR